MNIFILKLILAPLIIGTASLAGRRWGPAVSGWLVGLPLTTGPVVFFVAVSHSTPFAASTVLGVLSGGISLVAFCISYSRLSAHFRWPISISGSLAVFGTITTLMQNFIQPLWIIFPMLLAAILAGFWLMPKETELVTIDVKPGRWDLPARILIGSSFIVGLTAIAPFIGPRLTGLISTIPLYTAILAVFAQRLHGPAGANSVLRGLLLGLFGFAGFFLVLALSLERTGITTAFMLAIATTIAIQSLSFLVLRHYNFKIRRSL